MMSASNCFHENDFSHRVSKTRDLLKGLTLSPSQDPCKQLTLLKKTVDHVRCCRPGYTYSSLCRQIANLSFDVGDKRDGIFHLIESHGVIMRHKVLSRYFKNLRKNNNDGSVMDKKYVEFVKEKNYGYYYILNQLKEMPEEWTVIQVTCMVDTPWRFGGLELCKWTPNLNVVRMECSSQPEFEPLHLHLAPPPEASNFAALEHLHSFIRRNCTNHLRKDKYEFWKARNQLDSMLSDVIQFMNTKWFSSIGPFLTGHLCDLKMRKKIRKQVAEIISNISKECNVNVSREHFCLLVKTAENLDVVDDFALTSILAKALNKAKLSSAVKKLWKEFDVLRKEFAQKTSNIRRGPVILIIDEKLENLPFEQLYILKNHPVTRVQSFHILHGLFSVHRSSIESGLKVVDAQRGFYIINPSSDLKAMEKRMSSFLVPRVPQWSGVVGQEIDGEQWCQIVKEKDILVYMGHGSGGQYYNVEQIAGGVRSLSALFGCNSAGIKIMTGEAEVDACLQAFQACACPSVVGMLWAVTDVDTDLAAQAFLDACLPKYNKELSINNEVSSERRGRRKVVANCCAEDNQQHSMNAIEPEVARAIIHGRKATRMLVTRAGLVVRGLPVVIK